jgi:D-glycero-D-manno-heptose 1,7-bisphosphate phosphatase
MQRKQRASDIRILLRMTMPLRKAIFLDRDGVINRKLPENNYVRTCSEFEFLPNTAEALSILRRLGFLLVIVTNQRGIARGYMTLSDLANVHQFMHRELERSQVALDAVYYCPHDEAQQCTCRKPQAGMLLKAAQDLPISLGESYIVGDSSSDILAGKKAGAHTVRVAHERDDNAELTFPTLLDFALFLARKARVNPDEQP